MRFIRYEHKSAEKLAVVIDSELIYDLNFQNILEVIEQANNQNISVQAFISKYIESNSPLQESLNDLNLLTPIVAPEVWAAGVTYARSKSARNYESTNGKLNVETFYDKVYDAKRPELFMKSTDKRTVGPNQALYLRNDSNWQIPEPELGLVLDSEGAIFGYTIGNDLSSRDIEGENPLYLPQAKIWENSCSIGPSVLLAETVEDPYDFEIICKVYRNEKLVFEGSANTSQLHRKYDELVFYLKQNNIIFDGTVLLTGTCIVPPNEFTLNHDDVIEIEIPNIGILKNPVKQILKEESC